MNAVEYDNENHRFTINKIYEYSPVINVKQDYSPERFTLKTLYNTRPDYGENCIYQVYIHDEKNIRIGWIFPAQALFSDQHDYAENTYFLRYAYIALYKLFEKHVEIIEEEFDGCAFLVIDRDNCSKIQDFDIDDYIISLYSYGYTITGKGNLFEYVNKIEGKHLHLKPIAKALKDEAPYLLRLFKEHLPKSSDAIATFLLFYQIIEILISIIFRDTFEKFIKIISVDKNIDLLEMKENLIEKTSEKGRIKILFANRVKIDSDLTNALNESCDRFLEKYEGSKTSFEFANETKDTAEKLYSVRCKLVHSCYMLDSEGMGLIDYINNVFSMIAVEMLTSFKLNI